MRETVVRRHARCMAVRTLLLGMILFGNPTPLWPSRANYCVACHMAAVNLV